MKHSKLLSVSILIASILLLSDANNISAASNQTRPNQHKKAANKQPNATQQREQEPTVPLSVYQTTESTLLEAIRTIRTQQETAAKQTRARYEPFYAPSNVISFGLLVVGALYSIFAWWQWTAIKEQARIARAMLAANRIALNANRKSADAAKQAADVAERAFHIDKPVLIPDNFVFLDEMLAKTAKVVASPEPILNEAWLIKPLGVPVTFTLTNYGRRPAEIKKIVGRIALVEKINDIPIGDFDQCENWLIPCNVLRANETTTVSSPIGALLFPKVYSGWFSPDEQRDIINREKLLVAYGQISYSDVGAEVLFCSDFFCMYSAFALANFGGGAALHGPQDRNQRHE